MQASFSAIKKMAKNLYRARVKGDTLLEPMGVTWHTTNACNFRCDYCDDGKGNMYPELGGKIMTTAQAKQVLGLARQKVGYLYITGGEPMIRKDIDEMVRWAKQDAKFTYVGMISNGVLLHKKEHLLRHVDDLAISLDCIDEEKYDRILNVGAGATSEIKAAVMRYSKLANRYGYRFNVSCVAMPDSLHDAEEVMNFCLDNGIGYSVMPQSIGPYPHPELRDNPTYTALIDEVIARKREGHPIWGTYAYYKTVRDFTKFQCYPTVAPRIFPNGDLLYPCSPLDTIAGNLVGAESFDQVFLEGIEKHGPIPECDARCFASCYIETSHALTFPTSIMWENFALWERVRGALRKVSPSRFGSSRKRVTKKNGANGTPVSVVESYGDDGERRIHLPMA